MFDKVKKIHLEEYLPNVINKFGHAILHGSGDIFVDVEFDAKGNPIDAKHQQSYLAKKFAAPLNEEATYAIRFTNVNQIPDNMVDLERMFLAAKAKEKAQESEQKLAPGALIMDIPVKKEEPKEIIQKVQIEEKKKSGRPPKA